RGRNGGRTQYTNVAAFILSQLNKIKGLLHHLPNLPHQLTLMVLKVVGTPPMLCIVVYMK
ncbi:MAG: hypothetical protein MI922_23460, partial [Bacteroidales bacterium]|nr:hypothetical protein [Bacteroidales bacterium]